ncbi:MAG: hypothetical protein QOK44_5576 [Betaproteobacteria bacterium]|jgi:hypothetical protein|nr:hypothetical protein [Betaproteobacteria bacterium]
MKAAVIFCVPMITANGFAWRWRSEDHTEDSTHPFAYHADCVTDAERNGYMVGMDRMKARSDLVSGAAGKPAGARDSSGSFPRPS